MKNTKLNIQEKIFIRKKASLCTGKGWWETKQFSEKSIKPIIFSDGSNGVRFQKESRKLCGKNFYSNLENSLYDSNSAIEETYNATCFPSGGTMAFSWDKELIEKIGEKIALECQAIGIDVLLGPSINIRRSIYDGRNYEYYSEDPILTGELAVSFILGLQKKGIAACIKHFACYNSQSNRTNINSIIDERSMREVYLKGFEIAVKKASPFFIMSSYNKINGISVSENRLLLTEILRNEWNYSGLVISDWGAVKNISKALKAGINIIMPENKWVDDEVENSIVNGYLNENDIDSKIYNNLLIISRIQNNIRYSNEVEWNKHHDFSVKIAEESIVLLKNENAILPFKKKYIKNLLVVGEYATDPIIQGVATTIINQTIQNDPLKEIKNYCSSIGINVSYLEKIIVSDKDSTNKNIEKIIESDIVCTFVGQKPTKDIENGDRYNFNLDNNGDKEIDFISKYCKKQVVIIMAGDAILMPWIDNIKSAVFAGLGGQGFSEAITKILFGIVNPSAKTTFTFPRNIYDLPSYIDYPPHNNSLFYGERCYVGYRSFFKRKLTPLIPFGYGLTYTKFAYHSLKIDKTVLTNDDVINLTFIIENIGDCKGKEVVQLYIRQFSTDLIMLKKFKKICLKPNESFKVSFTLSNEDFSFFDPVEKSWGLVTGDYELLIGESSVSFYFKRLISVKNIFKKIYTEESLFREILESDKAKDILVNFLIKHNCLEKYQVTSRFFNLLNDCFWDIQTAIGLFTNYKIPISSIRKLINEMNKIEEE